MNLSKDVDIFIRDHKTGRDLHITKVWIGGNDEIVIGDDSNEDLLFIGALNALELAEAIIEVCGDYCEEIKDKLIAIGANK